MMYLHEEHPTIMTSSLTQPIGNNADAYTGLFVHDIPLIDVRAP